MENLRIQGYKGTWYVIDECFYNGKKYYMLESEIWGDEVPALIVNSDMNIVIDNMGFKIDDVYDDILHTLKERLN